MPTSPLSLCVVTGCPNLVPHGKCEDHRLEGRRDSDAHRPTAYQRGYDRAWQHTRTEYLQAHPNCECDQCTALPIWQRPQATDVDHIDGRGPHGPHGHDWANLQALTHAHHSRKTVTHDGGFRRH